MNAKAWRSWLLPGGVLLSLAVVLVNSPLLAQVASSLSFYYAAAFAAGLVLALRFNSSRILFSLITLLLAHRAVDFFSAGHAHSGPGHMAVTLTALLIALNFIVFAAMRERGFVIAGIAPRFGLLFVESVVVAILCRPENSIVPARRMPGMAGIPVWAMAGLVCAVGLFIRRYLQTHKPVEPGFVWSIGAVFLWLQVAPIGKAADAYVATAALIIAASLIETSYVLAYHDELTGIRARRAFNEALLSLDQQYAIAIVDIDHFKKFNDTYGHDVGDQVLCMVATRISKVEGGGQAFRCGGEEFAVIFRGASAKDAFEHLEALRKTIEQSVFRMRSADRRAVRSTEKASDRRMAGEADRRKPARKKSASAPVLSEAPEGLSVTVSIGVAEPSTRYRQPDQVINAADQALYRAKQRGRNRVEMASTAALRLERTKRVKASRS
ncbi:MAG: GGDEF domain-containing protein [Terriglobales bacterium]